MFNPFSVFTELARLSCYITGWVAQKFGKEKIYFSMKIRADRWHQWTLFMEGVGPLPKNKIKE